MSAPDDIASGEAVARWSRRRSMSTRRERGGLAPLREPGVSLILVPYRLSLSGTDTECGAHRPQTVDGGAPTTRSLTARCSRRLVRPGTR